jgi:hypothetical protein
MAAPALFPPPILPAPTGAPVAPILFSASASNVLDEATWRLQVQALNVAPAELHDVQKTDGAVASLRRLQHPYLGCLLGDKLPRFDEASEGDCDGAFKVLGLNAEDCRLFLPFPKLSPLEKSLLQAEVLSRDSIQKVLSRDSIKKPASIPFILDIPQEVCRLRYQPPKRQLFDALDPNNKSTDPQPLFVQNIELVTDKNEDSFFEIQTNLYRFDSAIVGSEKVVCQNVCTRTFGHCS